MLARPPRGTLSSLQSRRPRVVPKPPSAPAVPNSWRRGEPIGTASAPRLLAGAAATMASASPSAAPRQLGRATLAMAGPPARLAAGLNEKVTMEWLLAGVDGAMAQPVQSPVHGTTREWTGPAGSSRETAV